MKKISLRTPEGEERYRQQREKRKGDDCPLCNDKETLQFFTYWRIVENSFPYDQFAEVHHMILPLEHKGERDLTTPEKEELLSLKETYIAEHYNFIMESTHLQKSIPQHFHLHLIIPKEPKESV